MLQALDGDRFDMVVGSDLTYIPEATESLFWTVSQLLQKAQKDKYDCKRASSLRTRCLLRIFSLLQHHFPSNSGVILRFSALRAKTRSCSARGFVQQRRRRLDRLLQARLSHSRRRRGLRPAALALLQ